MTRDQNAHIHIRISPDLKAHLQRQADNRGLPLSSWIKLTLAESSGYKAPQGAEPR